MCTTGSQMCTTGGALKAGHVEAQETPKVGATEPLRLRVSYVAPRRRSYIHFYGW